jgi:hypothetical protein
MVEEICLTPTLIDNREIEGNMLQDGLSRNKKETCCGIETTTNLNQIHA